jgi:hypothetical protein
MAIIKNTYDTVPHLNAPSELLRSHLLPGEELLAVAEQDRIVVWSCVSAWLLLAAIALFFHLWQVGMWLGVAAVGTYVWTDFKWKQLQIGLTDRRVITTQWVRLRRETVDMPLSKIESVIVEEAADGSYGTLRISGTGSVVLRFEHMREPSRFRHAIQAQLETIHQHHV